MLLIFEDFNVLFLLRRLEKETLKGGGVEGRRFEISSDLVCKHSVIRLLKLILDQIGRKTDKT